MSGSRGGDCEISGNPSKIGSQAQKNGDPGGGGPWGWRTLKVADLGAGGPWGWRTLGMADPNQKQKSLKRPKIQRNVMSSYKLISV